MNTEKESYPERKSFKSSKRNGKFTSRTSEDAQDLRFAGLTKAEFVAWYIIFLLRLKGYPNEERYLTLKVLCPKFVRLLLGINSALGDSWKIEIQTQKTTTKFLKTFINALQGFIDGLVLISDEDYLDSIGFDFSFVCCPQKLFDTLCNLSYGWKKIKNRGRVSSTQQPTKFLAPEKQEWIYDIFRVIEEDYSKKVKGTWDPLMLERQRNEKKEFGNFWKNLSKNQKTRFLLLGNEDIKSLILDIETEDTKIQPSLLEQQIDENINLDKKQICNKVFKCKIKKCSLEICAYYEAIYKNWRDFTFKKKSELKLAKKKVKPENKREKSLDQYSNQTNQTELKYSRIELDETELYNHLEEDVLECTDQISENSNKFHERRVLAFERISAIFRLYNISCRLFGSCANGITIKQSDIDIAINEQILKMFAMQQDKKSQMSKAFEFMGQIFQSLPWVKNVKVIKTAAIPIIKLTINTQVEVNQQFFTEEYREILNRKIENGGDVHADLTIQTTQQEKQTSAHLGVISTHQINKWLEEIPSLRTIVILLKLQIANKSLNETYLGGLNTYCLVVMIASYIYSAKLEEEKNVAVVLMKLLTFYGWQFDEKVYGIDLRDKSCIFYEKPKNQLNKFAELEVKDPLNHGKIMTKNCYQFAKIKEIFQNIYTKCFVEKEKLLKDQYLKTKKKLSKRKTKQQSETESGSEKEKLKNYFLELAA